MIAYFCAEYALDPRLRTYAGGLGILAGDTVKEMGDQGIPFVAVGLYYYKGYLAREYDWTTPESADLQLIRDERGEVLLVQVPIGERDVYARAWIYRYKSATVYFLDTMLHQNHPADQQLSYYLYDEDIRVRLAQEMMLGLGGARLLKQIGIKPQVYHMNEGHSVFLSLEVPDDTTIVFTNHTVVAEGNHMYDQTLIRSMFARYMSVPQKWSIEELIERGLCQYPGVFSLTSMAMRMAQKVNGVSMLHAHKLSELYPDYHPIAITNGVHINTWFRSHSHHHTTAQLTPDELVQVHEENKANMLLYLEHTAGIRWDPHVLTIGWARRIIKYKQPLALFADVARLGRILSNTSTPVRIVLSGIPHPKDQWANDALRLVLSLLTEKFRNQVVYVPNYSPQVAKVLVSGCDVWVNTPQVGLEACGTSGMKASLNGVLALSTADGWMAEVDIEKIGWKLDEKNMSESIYKTLEEQIIPAYTTYLTHHDRFGWGAKMYAGHTLIKERFSTTRMVKDYMEHMWAVSQKATNDVLAHGHMDYSIRRPYINTKPPIYAQE